MTTIVVDIYPSALIDIPGSSGRIHTEKNLSLLAKAYGSSHIISGTINCNSGSVEFVNTIVVIDGRVIRLNGSVDHNSSGTLYIKAHFDDNDHILAGYQAVSIDTSSPTDNSYIKLGDISSNNKLVLRQEAFSGLEGDEYISKLINMINSTNNEVFSITTRVNTLENYDLDNRVDVLEQKINDITSVGGEPNTIETIKVDGVKLSPDSNKAVDIKIASATAKKVSNKLTVGSKTYDGSSSVVINSTDLNTYNKTESELRYAKSNIYASTSVYGLVKVDGSTIRSSNGIISASEYSLPAAGYNKLGGVKTTSSISSASGLTACPIIDGVPYYKSGVTEEGLPVDTNTTYTITKSGSTITLKGSDGSTTSVTDSNTNTTYSIATSATEGLVKIGYSESGKNYAVKLDNGKMFVTVPWTDNNTTYSKATSSAYGLVKIGYSGSGKNYAVQLNDNGQMYVSVPWTDNNTTYSKATSSSLGLVKIGYSQNERNYPVELDSNGKMFVNVPWIQGDNITYATATSNTLGIIKVAANRTTEPSITFGKTTSGRYYGVELDKNGKAFVNIPWTDTTYTHPSYNEHDIGFYRVKVDSKGHVSAIDKVSKSDITALGIPGKDTTYSTATYQSNGLMSASDKMNLDNIIEWDDI